MEKQIFFGDDLGKIIKDYQNIIRFPPFLLGEVVVVLELEHNMGLIGRELRGFDFEDFQQA